MRYLFALILLLACGHAKAQSDSCGLLKNLHYKNGVAHITLKATYQEIDRGAPLDIAILRKLQKQGTIFISPYWCLKNTNRLIPNRIIFT